MKKLFIIYILSIFTLTGCFNFIEGHPDTSKLKAAISNANILLKSKTIGTDTGNISQEDYDLYKNAITVATNTLANSDDLNQKDIDSAVEILATATSTFKSSIIGSSDINYLYSTNEAVDIETTISGWEYSTEEVVNSEYYNPCLKASRGEWAVHLQFESNTKVFKGYSTLEFIIKADDPEINVIFDNKSSGSDGYDSYTETGNFTWASDDTIVTGVTKTKDESGWYKISIDLSILDSDKIAEATKLLIKMDSSEGNSSMYITNIALIK